MKKDTIIKGIVLTSTIATIPPEAAEAFSLSDLIKNNDSNIVKNNKTKNVFYAEIDNKAKENSRKVDTNESSPAKKTVKTVDPIAGNVLTVTLNEGDLMPAIEGNPDAYETIIVTTTGNRKLTVKDFRALNASLIPNIDLSNASSENIPDKAFKDNKQLKTFKFPQDVLVISAEAFDGCSNLEGVLNIPETITTIEASAYEGCSKLSGDLSIPDSVTYIGVAAFKGCYGFRGELTLPKDITVISESSFDGCSRLTGSITIPEGVVTIEKAAFRGCSALTGGITIPNKVTSIGQNAFSGCKGLDGGLIIGNAVEAIGQGAFNGCSKLTGDLNIPNSVRTIGKSAFQDCSSLDGELTISESITVIESTTFANCSSLRGELKIHDKITSIGSEAFKDCRSFTGALTIPSSVTQIGKGAFTNCSRLDGELTIPATITKIDNLVFAGCSGLTGNLIIPATITSIGEGAFFECAGFEGILNIPNSVRTIGEEAFYKCSGLTGDLVVPESITEIGDKAFYGCLGFEGTLSMSNKVEHIGDAAFGECRGLTGTLTIPNTVKYIGAQAFINCQGITGTILIPNSVEEIGIVAFIGMDNAEFVLAVNDKFADTNYRESIVKNLIDFLDTDSLHIEVPYNFDATKTWLKEIDQEYIKKPVVNETDTYTSLSIPTPYKESKIKITKDGQDINLPALEDGSYKFTERGEYEVVVITDLETKSIVPFKVATPVEDSNIVYENGILTIKEVPGNQNIKMRYRINEGEWKDYEGPFMLESESKFIKLEIKVIVDEATGDEYIIENNIEMFPATINAVDKVIKLGSTFDVREGITAVDIDGVDIAKENIEVVFNEVKTDKIGDYKVKYRVVGKNKYPAEKTINIKVVGPVIIAENKTILVGEEFNELAGVTAKDSTGKDITNSIVVVENKVESNKVGVYPVTYKVIEDTMVVTKTIYVTVAEKQNIEDNKPGQEDNNKPSQGENNNSNQNANFDVVLKDLTIKLNSSFDPLKNVKITDKNGNDITSQVAIKVLYNNVNTSVLGEYKVTYEFTHNNQTITREMKVFVTKDGSTNPTISGSTGTNGNTNTNTNGSGNNNTNKPQTGDSSVVMYAGLTGASIIGLLVNNKKNKNKDE